MVVPLSVQVSYGISSVIDLFIIVVALMIGFQSRRLARMPRCYSFKYFSWGFFLIAGAYFSKIISNFTVGHRLVIESRNFVYVLFHELEWVKVLHFFSYLIFEVLLLLGFLVLFMVLFDLKRKEEMFMFGYLSLFVVLFSIYYQFLFHLTIAVVLLMLAVKFYKNYCLVDSKSSFFIFMAFAIMFVSYLVGVLNPFDPAVHLVSETFLLLGFVTLLITHMRMYYGK